MENKENPMLILTYIETEINEGKKLLGGTKVAVEYKVIMDLISRLRVALKEMSGQNLIEDAKEKAREIVEMATNKKEEMIRDAMNNNEIYERANAILQQTRTEKQKIEQNLADNMFNALELVKNEIESYNNKIGALNKQILDSIESAENRIRNKTGL